jgi:hypothetical protein
MTGSPIPSNGYTCYVQHPNGIKAEWLPVVALVPIGKYGEYVAAVLDRYGNLQPVTTLESPYLVVVAEKDEAA